LIGTVSTTERRARTATSADADALVALAGAFYAEDGFVTPTGQLRANLQHLLADGSAYVRVVPSAEGLSAFAITTTSFGLENGLIAELEDLFVIPDARRQGVAELLIDDSAQWARSRGCSHLEVVVAPNGRNVSQLLHYYTARQFSAEGRQLLVRELAHERGVF